MNWITPKDRVKMRQRLTKKMPVPVWALLVFIAFAVMAAGGLLAQVIDSESAAAVKAYKEAEYLKTASLSDIQELTVKTAWYRAGQFSGFVLVVLTVGAAIGLSHGISIVRVSK